MMQRVIPLFMNRFSGLNVYYNDETKKPIEAARVT